MRTRCILALWLFTSVANCFADGPRVVGISIATAEPDELTKFYTDVLSFQEVRTQTLTGAVAKELTGSETAKVRLRELRLGDDLLELREVQGIKTEPVPAIFSSKHPQFQHIAIVVSDIDRAYERIRHSNVRFVSPGPQTIPLSNTAAGGIRALYFRDPENHPLELIWFPPGKGAARWHVRRASLFLGLDHTAIVVRNTGIGRHFYQRLFGLREVGQSENFGVEQERLSGVPGAHLLITGLHGDGGIGLKFLDYLSPPDTLPSLPLRFEDPARTETLIAVGSHFHLPAGAVETLLPDRRFIFLHAPDGHSVRVIAPKLH